ncbi:MAG: galactokinase family protein [Oscillospiraceae bacterium]|nr:galactokinase family protein [Oscillospiraceae bacterium]MDD4546547.1 galactokinase family protein [Oscillospiraceae bacterium]
MNTIKNIITQIKSGVYDRAFMRMYGFNAIEVHRERYKKAVNKFGEIFGTEKEVMLFSAPGRTEIGGNHTDHNHGRVLAASVNLDVIGVASLSSENCIKIKSEGFDMDTVYLDDLAVQNDQKGCSASLIRGMAESFVKNGFNIGGFDAYTTSDVLKGSGLSSSAAFEVLIGTILNSLYNSRKADGVKIAQMAQYAENVHFGKPCGLMDQMASSIGGVITIDFNDPTNPITEKVNFDFDKSGYNLCIVDTGGNHADLTPEYASITIEMKAVSKSLGVSYLRETSMEKLMNKLPELRKLHGDRAVLRAIHFLRENQRVTKQVEALEFGDFDEFCRLIIESGHSSFEYLQNSYSSCNVTEQGLPLALCLAQGVLNDNGAWRVHGGGFAGTTQNFVPGELLDSFCSVMEGVFGKNSCHVLKIRPVGGVELDYLSTQNSTTLG